MRPTSSRTLSTAVLVQALSLGCAAGSGAQPARSASAAPISLAVDATEAPRNLLHAKLTFPARPGPLTLVYPKWIPGEHGPTGPIANLGGLRLSADGKAVPWRRDDVDMYAFHCDVPAGARTLEVELDYIGSWATSGFSGGASTSPALLDLSWNQVLVYPEGSGAEDLMISARLKLPPGFHYGTSLPVASEGADSVVFAPVPLATLVDSPVVAGAHFRSVDLGGAPSHRIDMVADSDAALEMPPEQVAAYKRLVAEAGALFGARHYRSYRFLYTLSDHVASFGLEHHESSDNRVGERTLIDEARGKIEASLLPHEFVHSWNGKHRRPSGLMTRDYQSPMRGELLWVYEGLTEYLGDVLTARSGLWSEADYKEALAMSAAALDHTPGRTWRPLADTAIAAQVTYHAPSAYRALRRGVDFYAEGELIWLEADVLIRKQTKGARSLDDFCRRFFGGEDGPPAVRTYTLDEVLKALGEVAPYDWRGFFQARLESTAPGAPLGGITGGGYRLVYNDTPSAAWERMEKVEDTIALPHSLGVLLKSDGRIADVVPGTPAAKAGLAPGMRVLAVNGRRYTGDVLRDALKADKQATSRVELIVETGDFVRIYAVEGGGGLRYPHLERDGASEDVLSAILKPQAQQAAAARRAAR